MKVPLSPTLGLDKNTGFIESAKKCGGKSAISKLRKLDA
jgi:hypothetical protein